MITAADFSKLTYRKPILFDKKPEIEHIVGIDSEAYTDGTPFMFCTSLGDVIRPDAMPAVLFRPHLRGAHFVVWNLKYDSGAFLSHLTEEQLFVLWAEGSIKISIETDGGPSLQYRYKYIPHKLLRIWCGKEAVSFWDVSQFYKSSLGAAAEKYLGRKKIDLQTKRFTRRYVSRFHKAIAKYCIQDAVLTADLGKHLVRKLKSFGITTTAMYSCASIAFTHFCNNSKIVTSWRWWKNDKQLLRLACDAYEGGKFEVTSRGRFTGYEYDITSAYPYEIANLVNINNATVVHSREYQPKAVYGFLRCFVDNPDGKHLPCGPMIRNVRIYPAGRFFLAMTKAEYEYLLEIGVHVEIIEAVWMFVKRRTYPYGNVITQLFNIKESSKGRDLMVYNTSKTLSNSFYGKLAQCIEQRNGSIQAGVGWNPMYAAVITANTRLKVTRMQNLLGDKCLAVHTDSVICTEPLPGEMITGELGEFGFEVEGSGVIIACGMYQIANQCAFKGFRPKEGESWESILGKYLRRKTIPQPIVHVESWIESMAKHHGTGPINVFEKEKKRINLNCDVKRTWMRDVRAGELLTESEGSYPRIHVEEEMPKHWRDQ